MAKDDFGIQQVAALVAQRVADAAAKRFTGKVQFTLHMREGGVGALHVEIAEVISPQKQGPAGAATTI